MNVVRFEVPGEPKGKGRPRFAKVKDRVITRTPDDTILYENQIKIEYQKATVCYFPADYALSLDIYAYFSVPKSASKKKREEMLAGGIRPTKKPDWDNIGKVVSDALNGVAYHDDTQIVTARVFKRYSERPRLSITIAEAVH